MLISRGCGAIKNGLEIGIEDAIDAKIEYPHQQDATKRKCTLFQFLEHTAVIQRASKPWDIFFFLRVGKWTVEIYQKKKFTPRVCIFKGKRQVHRFQVLNSFVKLTLDLPPLSFVILWRRVSFYLFFFLSFNFSTKSAQFIHPSSCLYFPYSLRLEILHIDINLVRSI
ncbi:hypothetical protein RIF29_36319 [Crotalaria pallida]|uniref:Uncharacterized protein n=1 Tax=Crotalaria pallida TaxID=3830 RepID=A0AAN9EGJ8_CROPI